MNVAVFCWTTLVLVAGLMALRCVPRRPFDPTVLDVAFALCLALTVSLVHPG